MGELVCKMALGIAQHHGLQQEFLIVVLRPLLKIEQTALPGELPSQGANARHADSDDVVHTRTKLALKGLIGRILQGKKRFPDAGNG